MHTIYTTEGFILKSLNFGEANKYFFIFTQDFGLIKATAQSVRHNKSKLRYNLEDLSLGHISVVRGRELWRITSAKKNINFNFTGQSHNLDKVHLIARIFSLLLRLLHGEEKNEALFSTLKSGFEFLEQKYLNEKDLENFECILALRILWALGYMGKPIKGDFDQFTTTPYFTSDLLSSMASLRTQVILEINKSLKETQL